MKGQDEKKVTFLGSLFAVLGYFLGETFISHICLLLDKVVGNNLNVTQIQAFYSLLKYRYVVLFLIIMIFWTFGTCIQILVNAKLSEKKNNKKIIDTKAYPKK